MHIGTATADADYATATMNLTFTANVLNGTIKCLNVSIIEDFLVEGDEIFTVNVSLLNTDNGITLENDIATVVITDNEGKSFNKGLAYPVILSSIEQFPLQRTIIVSVL